MVAAYRYDPFGILLAKSGSLTQPFQFSTKRYDARTGLVYYGYRFYAPLMGRWMTRDPLGEIGGINLYAFVGNNPVNWVDPWGLQYAGDIGGQLTAELLALLAELKAFLGTGVAVSGTTLAGVGVGAAAFLIPRTAECPTEIPLPVAMPIPIPISMPMARQRGHSDPYTLPRVNPGRDADGNCNPCPPDGPVWTHTHTDGTVNSHQVVYDQDLITCECFPNRIHL